MVPTNVYKLLLYIEDAKVEPENQRTSTFQGGGRGVSFRRKRWFSGSIVTNRWRTWGSVEPPWNHLEPPLGEVSCNQCGCSSLTWNQHSCAPCGRYQYGERGLCRGFHPRSLSAGTVPHTRRRSSRRSCLSRAGARQTERRPGPSSGPGGRRTNPTGMCECRLSRRAVARCWCQPCGVAMVSQTSSQLCSTGLVTGPKSSLVTPADSAVDVRSLRDVLAAVKRRSS